MGTIKNLLIAAVAVSGISVAASQEADAGVRYYTKYGKQFKDISTVRTIHLTKYRYQIVVDHCGRKKRIRVPYRVCQRITSCRTYCREICYKNERRCYTRRVRVVDDCGRVRYVTRTYHRWVKVPVSSKWVYVRTSSSTAFV